MKRFCCDQRCNQGRDCPNITQHQMRFYNLIQSIKGLYARMFNRR